MILEARRRRLVPAVTMIDRNYGLELGKVAVVAPVAVSVVGFDVAATRDTGIVLAYIRR